MLVGEVCGRWRKPWSGVVNNQHRILAADKPVGLIEQLRLQRCRVQTTPGMFMMRWAKVRTALAVVSRLAVEIGMTSSSGGSPGMVVAVFAPLQFLACSRHVRAAGGGGASRSGSANGT
jgi:hypothetical protein